MITYKIDKNKISKKPIGCVIGSEADDGRFEYNNIVLGYMGGQNPILIKTNLTQELWDKFCDGKLSSKELDLYI